MSSPVLRTTTIRLSLKEAATALNHRDWGKMNDYLDVDYMEEVWHGGYRLADAKNFPEPAGMEGVAKVFPEIMVSAMEDAERDATGAAIGKARRDALVEGFERIKVRGSYDDNGNTIQLPYPTESPAILEAKLDTAKAEIALRIRNPEHLINDITYGIDRTVALDPYVAASDDVIKSHIITNAADYFDVYGDAIPDGELDSRFTPDIDDTFYAEEIKMRIEDMNADQLADAVTSAFEDGDVETMEEAIEIASRLTKIQYRDIEAAIAKGFHGTPQGIDFGKLRDLIEKGNRIKITKEGLERFQSYLAGQPSDRLITDIGIMEDPELKDRVYVYSKSAVLKDLVKPAKNPRQKGVKKDQVGPSRPPRPAGASDPSRPPRPAGAGRAWVGGRAWADKVPAKARENARLGLALRRIWGRGGTLIGVARARDLAGGKNLSRHTIKRMAAFNRHRKSSSPEREHRDGGPTAGYIAWLLWGGDEGINWAVKEAKKL